MEENTTADQFVRETVTQIKNAVLLLTVLPIAFVLGIATIVPSLAIAEGVLRFLSALVMGYVARGYTGLPMYLATIATIVQFLVGWYELRGDTEPDHLTIGFVLIDYSLVFAIIFLCSSYFAFKNLSTLTPTK